MSVTRNVYGGGQSWAKIPNVSQYDCKKAKVRCSIQWIISEAYRFEQTIPKHLSQKDVEEVFESDGGLKKTISFLLCSGDPYCKLMSRMFDLAEPVRSHEDVIQILCSKGLYLLDDADSLITANDLRKMPLVLEAHRIMMDMLMFAYLSHKFVSVHSLVKTIKKFSDLVASKELPDDLDEALILWLNKVSLKVQAIHRDALESDKHTFGQQKDDDARFPTIKNLTEDLRDGRALALLFHYYCPNHILFKDIKLKNPISVEDAWHNLQLGLDFCNDVILPQNSPLLNFISSSVLRPVDFLYCDDGMKHNMMLFLGSLFHYLEAEALQDVVSPRGHSVSCKRRRVESSEDATDNSSLYETCQYLSPTVSLEEEQNQKHSARYVPDVQPLISDATRQSFRKNDLPEVDSGSCTLDESSVDRNAPVPFSSKPLLVRRNRDRNWSSSSKACLEAAHTDRSLFFPNTKGMEFDYMSDGCDSSSVAVHPLRKSNSYQGLGYEPQLTDQPMPLINKWQLRATPVQDLRNTNISNNTRYEGPRFFKSPTEPVTSVNDTDLLSNVEMQNDSSDQDFDSSQNHIPSVPTAVHSRMGFQNFLYPKQGAVRAVDANDLTLETARTSDYLSSRSPGSRTADSDAISDLTSISPRTASSTLSSGETVDLARGGRASKDDIPQLVSVDRSPELPTNVTRVKPYRALGSSVASSVAAPSSQKSYTIQNGEFRTIHSARTAGYPIIDASPDTQHTVRQPIRASHDLRMANSSPRSGDRHKASPATEATSSKDQMLIGGTVVKLRGSQRKSNRASRNAKASSWMDQTKSGRSQVSDDQRRHSNVPGAEKMVGVFRKLEERRKFIETERRRIEERKKFIEEEKRRKEREWMHEYSKLQQEIGVLNLQVETVDKVDLRIKDKSLRQKSSQAMNRETSKNEDTSSDYSSKSPSPSSMNNNNLERADADPDVYTSCPSNPNFFASPLSTTTYLVASSQHHAHKRLNHPVVGPPEHIANQKSTFNIGSDREQSEVTPDQRTYDIPRSSANNSGGVSVLTSSAVLDSRTDSTCAMTPKSVRDHNSKTAKSREKKRTTPRENVTYEVAAADVASRGEPNSWNIKTEKSANDVTSSQFIATKNSDVRLRPGAEPAAMSQSEGGAAVHTSPDIKILQPLASEQSSRRNLFPTGNHDAAVSTEQENIDPNHLVVGQRADQTTYDSFSCKIVGGGSNQSTPHKGSPRQHRPEVEAAHLNAECGATTEISDGQVDKKGQGFEIIDDATPNMEISKKRDKFLMKQLKKEEEFKRKKAEREEQEEKRREEVRQKQDEIAAKKEEANLKRQQILERYKRNKQEREEAHLSNQSSAIISGASGKKQQKPQSSPIPMHGSKVKKAPASGRSSPVPDSGGSAVGKVNGSHPAGENKTVFRTRKLSASGRRDWDAESASSAVSSDYLGPKLYKQPSSKSNKHIVHNAICHCCLPGKVDGPLRDNTIQVLEMSETRHFMILFRDSKCQYRGLYSYNPESEKLHKLSGIGPSNITPSMIESLFKYNSGRKAFTALPSKTLSVGIDAITIKSTLWQSSKRPNTSKK